MKAFHFGDRRDQKVTAVFLSHTNIYLHKQAKSALTRPSSRTRSCYVGFPLNMKAVYLGDWRDQKVTAIFLLHTNVCTHTGKKRTYSPVVSDT